MVNQCQKVLKLLRERGERGIDSFEGYKMFIPRLSARINDLKNLGYQIITKRGLNKRSVVYILKEN